MVCLYAAAHLLTCLIVRNSGAFFFGNRFDHSVSILSETFSTGCISANRRGRKSDRRMDYGRCAPPSTTGRDQARHREYANFYSCALASGSEQCGRRCRRRPLHQLLPEYSILWCGRPDLCRAGHDMQFPSQRDDPLCARAVVDQGLGIFAGPDTDTIRLSHRYDGCHMAESGLVIWIKALSAAPTQG
jgi:hypothetical protein